MDLENTTKNNQDREIHDLEVKIDEASIMKNIKAVEIDELKKDKENLISELK